MKPAGSKQLISGTVRVTPNRDRSQLVGNCPTCSSRLSVEIRSDGSFGSLVACMRCKQLYRVEPQDGSAPSAAPPRGFGVTYAAVGPWDASAMMEYLFDTLGPVDRVAGGFICQPDEYHQGIPRIGVDEQTRTIRFDLFGHYQEAEAAAIINQAASEFGSTFHLTLQPLLLERWEHREQTRGFALVERRPLGTLLRERVKRQARA